MNVPCESVAPNTSSAVSVWVSKWTIPTGPWAAAQARAQGSVIGVVTAERERATRRRRAPPP